jgi:hypothetical protein
MRWLAAFSLFLVMGGAACTNRLVLFAGDGGSAPDDAGGSGGNGSGGRGSGGRDGGGGGSGGGNPDGSLPPACQSSRREIVIAPRSGAAVMMVVGRNSSMGTSLGTGTTRMRVVQDQIVKAIMERGGVVDFGYLDMPAVAPDMSCSPNAAGCCANPMPIPPTPFNRDSIVQRQLLCEGGGMTPGCVSSSSARPIADGLQRASDLYNMSPTPRGDERYVLLVVDGPPSCPAADPARSCDDAEIEVFQLKMGPRVQTYVIAVGEAAGADRCLQRLATAGGTQRPLFLGRDWDQLGASFSSVFDEITADSCRLDLLSFPFDLGAVSLQVYNEIVNVDLSGRNGWRFTPTSPGMPPTRIEVHGEDCLRMQAVDDIDIKVWECVPDGP